METVTQRSGNKLSKVLIKGLGAIVAASVAYRHRNPPQHVANAHNNGVIQEHSDQLAGAGDDVIDPHPFTLWVAKENDDIYEGYDLYYMSIVASPKNLNKSQNGYIKSVIRDAERIIEAAGAEDED